MRWGTELGPGGPHGTKHREWGALPGVRQPRESGSKSGAGPDHTAQKSHLHGRGPSPSRPRPGLEHRREPGAEPAGEARPGGDVRTGRAAEEGHWAVSAGASEVGQLTRSACRPSRSSRGGAGGVCPEPSLLLPDFVSCPSSAQPEGAGQTQALAPRAALRGRVGWLEAEIPLPLLHGPGDLPPLGRWTWWRSVWDRAARVCRQDCPHPPGCAQRRARADLGQPGPHPALPTLAWTGGRHPIISGRLRHGSPPSAIASAPRGDPAWPDSLKDSRGLERETGRATGRLFPPHGPPAW